MKFRVFINDDGNRFFTCFLCGGESQGKTEYKKDLKTFLFSSDSDARNNFCEQKIFIVPFLCGFCGKRFNNVLGSCWLPQGGAGQCAPKERHPFKAKFCNTPFKPAKELKKIQ